MPASGIRLILPKPVREVALEAPHVYTHRRKSGNVEESYAATELWERQQTAGQWSASGAQLTLAVMDYKPLPAATAPLASRTAINELLTSLKATPKEWSKKATMGAWLTAYFRTPAPFTVTPIATPPRNLQYLARISSSPDSKSVIYAFLLKTSLTRLNKAANRWFVIRFDCANRKTAATLNRTIIPSVLAKITVLRRTTSRSTPRRSSSGRSSTFGKQSTEYLENKQQVLNSIKNLSGWWHAETDNYILLSNYDRPAKISHIQKNIELIRAGFEQFMPPIKKVSAVSVIRLFATPKGYLAYVGDDLDWSGGVWMHSKKEMVIRPPQKSAPQSWQKQRRLEIVFHEGFHQYIYYAYDYRPISVWYNEGHANFFESAKIAGSRLIVSENKDSIKTLTKMAKAGTLDVRGLLAMDYQRFYGEDRSNNYALAWGLVYYLRKGAGPLRKKEYTKILDRYREAIDKTGVLSDVFSRFSLPEAATRYAFEGIDMDALEKDLTAFWKSTTQRGAAKRNKIFKAYRAR